MDSSIVSLSPDDSMSSIQETLPPDKIQLITEAIDWPSSRLETELESLLACSKLVLTGEVEGCDYETKMSSLKLTSRLLPLVPVFEMEDSLVAPVLQAALDSLQEVLKELGRGSQR